LAGRRGSLRGCPGVRVRVSPGVRLGVMPGVGGARAGRSPDTRTLKNRARERERERVRTAPFVDFAYLAGNIWVDAPACDVIRGLSRDPLANGHALPGGDPLTPVC